MLVEKSKSAMVIKCLHDAIHTYACTILHHLYVSFCSMEYGEKKKAAWTFRFTSWKEGFEISTECVCVLILLSLGCNLVMWYELRKK